MTKPAMDLVREAKTNEDFERSLEFWKLLAKMATHHVQVLELRIEALSKLPKVKTREEFLEWYKDRDKIAEEIYDFLVGGE